MSGPQSSSSSLSSPRAEAAYLSLRSLALAKRLRDIDELPTLEGFHPIGSHYTTTPLTPYDRDTLALLLSQTRENLLSLAQAEMHAVGFEPTRGLPHRSLNPAP